MTYFYWVVNSTVSKKYIVYTCMVNRIDKSSKLIDNFCLLNLYTRCKFLCIYNFCTIIILYKIWINKLHYNYLKQIYLLWILVIKWWEISKTEVIEIELNKQTLQGGKFCFFSLSSKISHLSIFLQGFSLFKIKDIALYILYFTLSFFKRSNRY